MAQAAAHAVGKKELKRVRVENIHLKRPITVDPETGADILIQAQVQEKSDSKSDKKNQYKIFKQNTGIREAYFSAEFILDLDDGPQKKYFKTETTTGYFPKLDLYRDNLLFQGPMFQRIQHVFSIFPKKGKMKRKLKKQYLPHEFMITKKHQKLHL
jgi:enediyne polyketide synthase